MYVCKWLCISKCEKLTAGVLLLVIHQVKVKNYHHQKAIKKDNKNQKTNKERREGRSEGERKQEGEMRDCTCCSAHLVRATLFGITIAMGYSLNIF